VRMESGCNWVRIKSDGGILVLMVVNLKVLPTCYYLIIYLFRPNISCSKIFLPYSY
jgi:hypothetical protein